MRLDDMYLDSFEIKDVKTLHGNHLARAIGSDVGSVLLSRESFCLCLSRRPCSLVCVLVTDVGQAVSLGKAEKSSSRSRTPVRPVSSSPTRQSHARLICALYADIPTVRFTSLDSCRTSDRRDAVVSLILGSPPGTSSKGHAFPRVISSPVADPIQARCTPT